MHTFFADCTYRLHSCIFQYHEFLFQTLRDKSASPTLELETRGLGYAAIKALRQALTDSGKYEFEFLGGSSGTYKLKKIDRREKLIGKWACISTLDRLSEL